MEIRRFDPLPWHRALICGALNAAFTGGAIATIWVGAPVHMCVVGIVAAVVTAVLTTRHVLSYFAFAKRISFYTRQGIAVVGSSAVDWLVAHQDELEDNIDQAITWFERWIVDHATRTVPIGRVRDFINGGQLWVAVQAGPLHDARWNLTARGLTWGNRSQVWYPQNGTNGPDLYLRAFPGSTVEKVFLTVIRHEVAQQCLNAMNIPTELHQKWMDDQGCPDR